MHYLASVKAITIAWMTVSVPYKRRSNTNLCFELSLLYAKCPGFFYFNSALYPHLIKSANIQLSTINQTKQPQKFLDCKKILNLIKIQVHA